MVEVKDSTGWPIVVGALVKVWQLPGQKPWRGWVRSIEEDPKHGPMLSVEHETKGGQRPVALSRAQEVRVLRPTTFQKSRKVGQDAERAQAAEKLKRRRTSSPRRKG